MPNICLTVRQFSCFVCILRKFSGKKNRGRRRSSNFSQTMKGRLQKFGKTTRICKWYFWLFYLFFSENTKLRFILSWFEIYLYIWHKQAKKDIYVVQLCQIKMARGARKIVSSTASLGIGKIKLRSYQGKALHQFTLLIVWSNHYNLFSSRQQHKFAYCSGTFRCYGRL